MNLLPSAELYLSGNVDSNDLLYNSNWLGYGVKAAWNAMKIIKYPAKKRVIEAKGEIIREEALATSMAIMTQIHMGRIRYSMLRKELHATNHYYSVQRQLLKQVRAQASAGSSGEQTVIRENMNTLVARVKRDVVYADFQNALASVFWSMGIDPYDATISIDQPVQEMTANLRNLWTTVVFLPTTMLPHPSKWRRPTEMVERFWANNTQMMRRVGALVGLGMTAVMLNPAWAQSLEQQQKVRAVVEAQDEAVLMARLQETLVKIPKRPGTGVQKG